MATKNHSNNSSAKRLRAMLPVQIREAEIAKLNFDYAGTRLRVCAYAKAVGLLSHLVAQAECSYPSLGWEHDTLPDGSRGDTRTPEKRKADRLRSKLLKLALGLETGMMVSRFLSITGEYKGARTRRKQLVELDRLFDQVALTAHPPAVRDVVAGRDRPLKKLV